MVPFTLPCCRKVYVEVTKVPSCPNSWPNRKCPPELCIQVRGYEPEDRDSGICWRCKAAVAGVSGADRESLRPRIDKATLVLGLDELGLTGRRRREEQNGNCWFCGATAGCKTCGAKEIEPDENEVKVEVTGKRKREYGSSKGKEVVKKVKVEKRDRKTPAHPFEYPTPNAAPHERYPYRQVFNQDHRGFDHSPQADPHGHGYGSNEFQHSPVSQADGATHFGGGQMQYPLPADWQSIYTHQAPSSGPSNACNDNNTEQFTDNHRQESSTAHSYSNEHWSHSEFALDPALYDDKGASSVNAGLWFDRVEQDDEEYVQAKSRYHSDQHRPGNVANMYPPLEQNDASRPSNSYVNEKHSSQYVLNGGQQDYKPLEYDSNGYPPNPYANRQPDSVLYNQESDSKRTSTDFTARRHEHNQAVHDESQLESKQGKSSQESGSSLDPNIQPGLDDIPSQVSIVPTTLSQL